MLSKQSQYTSLLDLLVRLSPDWREQIKDFRAKSIINGKAAKALYSMWTSSKNAVTPGVYKRSPTMSLDEISAMQEAGLIKDKGETIEITIKGGSVLKTMILGDDRSIFEDDGRVVAYETALANTKPRRTKTARKNASVQLDGNWYHSMRDNEQSNSNSKD